MRHLAQCLAQSERSVDGDNDGLGPKQTNLPGLRTGPADR